ncbi:MAG TPA: VOC family protein [Longimicrobiaceae bacterium]
MASLEASLAYYADALRFGVRWRDGGFALCGARGRGPDVVRGRPGTSGTWVYLGVSDADALHDELGARGALIRHPPTNHPWGARELQATDPDGHVLRFGSKATADEPVGEWLDGRGSGWLPEPGGGWRMVA